MTSEARRIADLWLAEKSLAARPGSTNQVKIANAYLAAEQGLLECAEARLKAEQEIERLRAAVALVVKEARMDKWARTKLEAALQQEREG